MNKFITKQLKEVSQLYPPFSQDGKDDQAVAWLKLYHPRSRFTFYVTEYNSETEDAYGWVVSERGSQDDHWGTINLKTLSEYKENKFQIENEWNFKLTKIEECKNKHP